MKKVFVVLSIISFLYFCGVVSNVLSSEIYCRKELAGNYIDDPKKAHVSFLRYRKDLESKYPIDFVESVIGIPFYLRVRMMFSDGPNQGDSFQEGYLTFFGFRYKLWDIC